MTQVLMILLLILLPLSLLLAALGSRSGVKALKLTGATTLTHGLFSLLIAFITMTSTIIEGIFSSVSSGGTSVQGLVLGRVLPGLSAAATCAKNTPADCNNYVTGSGGGIMQTLMFAAAPLLALVAARMILKMFGMGDMFKPGQMLGFMNSAAAAATGDNSIRKGMDSFHKEVGNSMRKEIRDPITGHSRSVSRFGLAGIGATLDNLMYDPEDPDSHVTGTWARTRREWADRGKRAKRWWGNKTGASAPTAAGHERLDQRASQVEGDHLLSAAAERTSFSDSLSERAAAGVLPGDPETSPLDAHSRFLDDQAEIGLNDPDLDEILGRGYRAQLEGAGPEAAVLGIDLSNPALVASLKAALDGRTLAEVELAGDVLGGVIDPSQISALAIGFSTKDAVHKVSATGHLSSGQHPLDLAVSVSGSQGVQAHQIRIDGFERMLESRVQVTTNASDVRLLDDGLKAAAVAKLSSQTGVRSGDIIVSTSGDYALAPLLMVDGRRSLDGETVESMRWGSRYVDCVREVDPATHKIEDNDHYVLRHNAIAYASGLTDSAGRDIDVYKMLGLDVDTNSSHRQRVQSWMNGSSDSLLDTLLHQRFQVPTALSSDARAAADKVFEDQFRSVNQMMEQRINTAFQVLDVSTRSMSAMLDGRLIPTIDKLSSSIDSLGGLRAASAGRELTASEDESRSVLAQSIFGEVSSMRDDLAALAQQSVAFKMAAASAENRSFNDSEALAEMNEGIEALVKEVERSSSFGAGRGVDSAAAAAQLEAAQVSLQKVLESASSLYSDGMSKLSEILNTPVQYARPADDDKPRTGRSVTPQNMMSAEDLLRTHAPS